MKRMDIMFNFFKRKNKDIKLDKNIKDKKIRLDNRIGDIVNIDFSLPIMQGKALPLPYYPNYNNLTPEQRYNYFKWLENIDNKPTDIGFAFLLLSELEKNIFCNYEVSQTVNVIAILHSNIWNDSFNYYSSAAIIYASHKYNRLEYLDYLNLKKAPEAVQVFYCLNMKGYLEPQDIVNIAKGVGFTNRRYINQDEEKFCELLKQELLNQFSEPWYKPNHKIEIRDYINIKLSAINVSEDSFAFPDVLSDPKLRREIFDLLQRAHDNFKKLKNGKSVRPVQKKINSPKKTSYKASQSSIQKAYLTYKENQKWYEEHPNDLLANILYHYNYGDYLYKNGEWSEAEKEWLSIIKDMYNNASVKLSILYRKQKRYKDDVDILKLAIFYGENYPNDIYKFNPDLYLRLEKSKSLYEKNKQIDQSKGIQE